MRILPGRPTNGETPLSDPHQFKREMSEAGFGEMMIHTIGHTMSIEFRIKSVELSSQVKLPYAEQGNSAGVPIIFLHGFLDSWHSFARVLPYLPDSIHAFAVTQRGLAPTVGGGGG